MGIFRQRYSPTDIHSSTLDNSVNTAEYFSNFEIGADELLDLSDDEVRKDGSAVADHKKPQYDSV